MTSEFRDQPWGTLKREVLQTVLDSDGPISSRGVADVLDAFEVEGSYAAIRSYLSRLKREGVLEYDGHGYLPKRSPVK
jgi:hypothetical protein